MDSGFFGDVRISAVMRNSAVRLMLQVIHFISFLGEMLRILDDICKEKQQ